ncbi:MAG: alpha/beta fold hydrolase [Ilumatobacter sp.]
MASTTAADGTTIAYDDHDGGDGTPVVLVHGITESSVSWDPVIPRLTSGRRVVSVDLRGHGRSGTAQDYGFEALAGDVTAVIDHLGLERPHIVGHSLGGVVVSVLGCTHDVASVVNVDQPLKLDDFGAQVGAMADQLRDPDAFPLVMGAVFDMMKGELISESEMARVNDARRPDQQVVLGIWDLLLNASSHDVAAAVESFLAGYAGGEVPYLSLFGLDPGDGYTEWLTARIPAATVESWADHGHYPHLVDVDRFVDRLEQFWS